MGLALVLQVLEVGDVVRVGGQVEQLLLDLVLVRQVVDGIVHLAFVVGLDGRVGEQRRQLFLQRRAVDDVVHVGGGEFGLLVVEHPPGAAEGAGLFLVAGDAATVLVGSLGFQGANQPGPWIVLGDRAVGDAGAIGVEQFLGRQFADTQLRRVRVLLIGAHAGLEVEHVQFGLGRQVVFAARLVDRAGTPGLPFADHLFVELRAQFLGDDDLAFAGLVADQAVPQFVGGAEGDIGVLEEIVGAGELVAFAFAGVDLVPGVVGGGDALEQFRRQVGGDHHALAVMGFVGQHIALLAFDPAEALVVVESGRRGVLVGQGRATVGGGLQRGELARIALEVVEADEVVEQLGIVVAGDHDFLAVAFIADGVGTHFVLRPDNRAIDRWPDFVVAGPTIPFAFAGGQAAQAGVGVLGLLEERRVVALRDDDLVAVLGLVADQAGAHFIGGADGFEVAELPGRRVVGAGPVVTVGLAGVDGAKGLEVFADLLEQLGVVALGDNDLVAVPGFIADQSRAHFVGGADGLVIRQAAGCRRVAGGQLVTLGEAVGQARQEFLVGHHLLVQPGVGGLADQHVIAVPGDETHRVGGQGVGLLDGRIAGQRRGLLIWPGLAVDGIVLLAGLEQHGKRGPGRRAIEGFRVGGSVQRLRLHARELL